MVGSWAWSSEADYVTASQHLGLMAVTSMTTCFHSPCPVLTEYAMEPLNSDTHGITIPALQRVG